MESYRAQLEILQLSGERKKTSVFKATHPFDSITATMPSKRDRIRNILPNLHLGYWKPGPKNSITDVPGVLVHSESIQMPQTSTKGAVNTGLTTILPRKDFFNHGCFAGIFRFNGCGELTGTHWIEESGLLHSPICLTNTFSVGAAHQGILEFCVKQSRDQKGRVDWFTLPVVGETFDGFLNDCGQFAVKPEHAVRGIELASEEAVPEGNTGGGTGMVCHNYKGGTGSSSRIVPGFKAGGKEAVDYTVGVLVQANYGRGRDLRIGGVPVGRLLEEVKQLTKEETQRSALEDSKSRHDGSIIIIVATSAPLNPVQLQRLSKRAAIGLARVGGNGHNQSGDIFLAFSTANDKSIPGLQGLYGEKKVDFYKPTPFEMQCVDDLSINGLFEAAADAVEEAIYNSLFCAETMVGLDGRRVEALDLERVKELVERYSPQ